MKVIATQLGFDNVALRNPGEEFEMPDDVFDAGGKHFFEPADEAGKARAAAGRKPDKKPDVPAVDPAKQTADQAAELERLAAEQAKEKGKKP